VVGFVLLWSRREGGRRRAFRIEPGEEWHFYLKRPVTESGYNRTQHEEERIEFGASVLGYSVKVCFSSGRVSPNLHNHVAAQSGERVG
jgi:hypothetical protein